MKKYVILLLLFSSPVFAQQKTDSLDSRSYIDVTAVPTMIDTLSKLIVYPEMARRAGIEGKVYLDIFINQKGIVEKANANRGSDSLFIDAAVSAIKKVRFTPALSPEHTPIDIWWTVPVYFRLPRD